MIKFLREYKAADKFPAKDERFPLLLQSITSSIFPAYCEFSLSVARDIEPFFDPFSNWATFGCIFLWTIVGFDIHNNGTICKTWCVEEDLASFST